MKTTFKTVLLAGLIAISMQSQAQLFGKKEPPKPVVLTSRPCKTLAARMTKEIQGNYG
jgi:hypothetical protein